MSATKSPTSSIAISISPISVSSDASFAVSSARSGNPTPTTIPTKPSWRKVADAQVARRHRSLHAGRDQSRHAAVQVSRPAARDQKRSSPISTSTPSRRWRSCTARGARRWTIRNISRCCATHGLGSIPGTAAEILDDSVREILSHKKVDVAAWVDIITTAHSLGVPTTSTIMYGHLESPRHVVNHLSLAARHPEADPRLHRVRAAALYP